MGDRWFDQLDRSGHAGRVGDLDLVAQLGVTALRYPVLWERVAPVGLAEADWSWPDERLERLRELGIRPVVGLLHHGNGPSDTSLVDPAFPRRFAEYARAVAERYPWVDAYIPINEPLTTARFSGLYGIWYPHGRDAETFARIQWNQIEATVLAVRAIKEVNPEAAFIQNEDLGKVHSTPLLAYEAEFQNRRRWLTFDMLCGRLRPPDPMWRYLVDAGTDPEKLERLEGHPCPPDVFGVDHYVLSERFLDEDMERYPEHFHAWNGLHRYADVEAVRAQAQPPAGVAGVLMEAWERYRSPLVLTEVQLAGPREEQLRWFAETWAVAADLREAGVDLRAMVVWALFGSYDWNTLVTRETGFYESGAFDIRGGARRRTAVARLVRSLATRGSFDHPVLASPGWWRRDTRLLYAVAEPGVLEPVAEVPTREPSPVAVVGARSPLMAQVLAACAARAIPSAGVDRLDDAWAAVVVGEEGTAVTRALTERGVAVATIAPAPAAGEGLRVRHGALFGPDGGDGWLMVKIEAVLCGDEVTVNDDPLVEPTYLPDLVDVALDLLIDDERGEWRLVSAGPMNLSRFLRLVAAAAGADAPAVRGGRRHDALPSRGSELMPPLADAVDRFVLARCDRVPEPATFWSDSLA